MRTRLIFGIFIAGLFALFIAGLSLGSVYIPFSAVGEFLTGGEINDARMNILSGIRLPRTLTAMLAGAGLSLSGLFLQTLFRNPLAGPSVLGISSGSGLGVALVLLAGIGAGQGAVIAGAVAGALVVVLLISYISVKFEDATLVLVAGLMLGFLSSSLVSVLAFFAPGDELKPFIHWGFGSFAGWSPIQIPALTTMLLLGAVSSFFLVKPLNALLPGDHFAGGIGIRVHRTRHLIILITGIITGTITAFSGPIGFIGLAVPQLVKLGFRTNNHGITIPASLLTGAIAAAACDIISRLPGADFALPLNAVTALFGAPVVLFVLFRMRSVKKLLS